MRNYIASLLVSVSFIGSAFALAELNVTHNVLVREGFSVVSCAREIERQTTAKVVQVMEAISVISVNANAQDATRIAKLRCVGTLEKNGMVSAGGRSASWIITSPNQKRILDQDRCAKAALDAAASLISNEIQEAGTDYPDHLYLADLHISSPGKYYAITFKDDSTILVQTRRSGAVCKANKPGRIGI